MSTQTIADVAVLEGLDFELTCRVFRIDHPDQGCPNPAAFYAEIHRVGDCKHEICNEHGNMCGNICRQHMDVVTRAARETIDAIPPVGPFGFPIGGVRCGSCGLVIRQVSDILQRVAAL